MTLRKPEDAFWRDVPEAVREDVLQRIVELAWSGERSSGDGVEICSLDEINALNIDFNGTILIDGREHEFHIRDGNNAGTEILGWNEDGRFELDRNERPVRALVPDTPAEVSEAIGSRRAGVLLRRWDADLDPATERGRALHDLPSRQAYDAFFDPGPKPHFDRIARRFGYRISDREEELVIRRRLHEAELRFAPVAPWPRTDPAEAAETYRRWAELETDEGQASILRRRVAARLAETRGGHVAAEENRELAAMGFRFVSPSEEPIIWSLGLAPHLEPEVEEGFDPADLPEDPVRGLFADFFRHTGENPSMDRRVDPIREASRIMSVALIEMGRDRTLEFPERHAVSLERVGYRLTNRITADPVTDLAGPEL
ncbi:hypothetical protein [Paracoccus sp. ME4]|uniref:hypothetical protein n=1 Tax=Paracoccus sp. ME4 TaxID=3138066 RepID=UPI00398BAD15